MSCSLVNGQDNFSINSWGFFLPLPQQLPSFCFVFPFCRRMYRRSWEMHGNSLKKLRPSIKWVTFQDSPNLVHTDSGALTEEHIPYLSGGCSVQACRALENQRCFCKGNILSPFYRLVKVRQGGLVSLSPCSLAGWHRCVIFTGAS